MNGLTLANTYDCKNKVIIANNAFMFDFSDEMNELIKINNIFLPFYIIISQK